MSDGPVRLAEIEAQEAVLAEFCGALDPDSVPLHEAAGAYGALCRMKKMISGAATLLARRVDESKSWVGSGHQSAADFLAEQAGISKNAANESLAASNQLQDLPETEEAVRNGELSDQQTTAIADAATANPTDESSLLESSKNESLSKLRDRCQRTKAAADKDRETTHRRIHKNRYLRRRTDGEGAYNLSMRTTPEAGAELDAALQPIIDRIFHTARQSGDHESAEAYGADALVELARNATGAHHPGASTDDGTAGDSGADARTTGGVTSATTPRSTRPESKVIALVDYDALRRGHTEAAETCQIAGVGPVPVSTVREMLTDAFLALVVTDGVDVYNVAHPGRQVSAHQRTALETRGYWCEVPECGVRHNLEIDHITGWAVTKHTKLDDLAWLCRHHHYQKTHLGYRLAGPPGHRRWASPTTGDPPDEDAAPPGDPPVDRSRPEAVDHPAPPPADMAESGASPPEVPTLFDAPPDAA